MKKSESSLEKKVCTYAKKMGWDNIKLHKRGYPDRLFLKNGFAFFIEFKRPDGKGVVSKSQDLVRKRLIKNGFYVFIGENLEYLKKLFE